MKRFIQGRVTAFQRLLWSFLGRMVKSDKLWQLVDATGIICFVGPNGSGKSLAMVHAVLPVLDGQAWHCETLSHAHQKRTREHVAKCTICEDEFAGFVCELAERIADPWLFADHVGFCLDCVPARAAKLCPVGDEFRLLFSDGVRLVYSTVPLLADDGSPHRLYRPLIDYKTLLEIEHSDVLFDEVAGISDASDSAAMPVQVVNWLHKLRKADVRLRVTTPAYARCSKPIRQACQVVVDARAFMPELRTSGRLWRPRQGMLYRAFDAFEFADYSPSTSERLPTLARAAYWRPGGRAESAYDTLGQVLALGHVTDAGMCVSCGGARARSKCSCVPARKAENLPAAGVLSRELVKGQTLQV